MRGSEYFEKFCEANRIPKKSGKVMRHMWPDVILSLTVKSAFFFVLYNCRHTNLVEMV